MKKEERDLWTIVTLDLDWHPENKSEYYMVMFVFVCEPEKFMMAKRPPEKYRGHNKMKYYRNLLN